MLINVNYYAYICSIKLYINTYIVTQGLTDLYAQFLRVCMIHLYIAAYVFKYVNIYECKY